jgi:hypothetical protein
MTPHPRYTTAAVCLIQRLCSSSHTISQVRHGTSTSGAGSGSRTGGYCRITPDTCAGAHEIPRGQAAAGG